MNPNCEVRDADELIATSLTWRFDQSERGWFVAEAPYGQVFMRMNKEMRCRHPAAPIFLPHGVGFNGRRT